MTQRRRKRERTRSRLLSLLLVLGMAAQAHAQRGPSLCSAAPYSITITQPDGSQLDVKGYGNILLNYTETTDGYAVVKNTKGIYEYAAPDGDGMLKPSGIAAHNAASRGIMEISYLQGIPVHLRFSEERARQATTMPQGNNIQNQGTDPGLNQQKGVYQSFPPQGKHKVLMLLIQYKNLKSQHTTAEFKNMMNQANYGGTGSYRDFYLKNSFGKLDLSVDVFGWYTSDSNYAYFGNNTTGNYPGMERARILVAQAIDSAHKAGVDFSQYDNDKDGNVDGILVVHSGPGAEEGSQGQYIWSHRWVLDAFSRTYNGVKIDNYNVMPEMRGGTNGHMVGIGVFCHEFGHLLGLPDFYDVNSKSEGVGDWSLMADGSWLGGEAYPAGFDAYSRLSLKWMQPIPVSGNKFYTLKPAETDSQIYILSTPVSHEYYLLENRQQKSYEKYLPGRGLAIWHVDDSVMTANLFNNTVNTDPKHMALYLEQADGKKELDTMNSPENRGDAGDLFPGSKNNFSFGDSSLPSSLTYRKTVTGIKIFKITQLPDSTISFGFGTLPQASIVAATKTVCQGGILSFGNKSLYAAKYAWSFNDDKTTDSSFTVRHSFKKAGTYTVKLAAISSSDTITYDSVKVTVNPRAVAAFSDSINRYDIIVTSTSTNAKSFICYWGDGRFNGGVSQSVKHTYGDTGTYTLSVIALNASGCNDTLKKSIHISGHNAGITEAAEPRDNIRVFPNPFSDQLIVQMVLDKPAMMEIVMYNALGQVVGVMDAGQVQAGLYTRNFNIGELNMPSGLYFIQFSINGSKRNISILRN